MDEKKEWPFFEEPTIEQRFRTINAQLEILIKRLELLHREISHGNALRIALIGSLVGAVVSMIVRAITGG